MSIRRRPPITNDIHIIPFIYNINHISVAGECIAVSIRVYVYDCVINYECDCIYLYIYIDLRVPSAVHVID